MEDGFARRLLNWHAMSGRKSLPWQIDPDPYRIWVSEIMLQQTRVDTVIPYYEKFMARFPTLPSLADAPLEEVMTCWAGLGYYARARNLHRAARIIRDEHHRVFPHRFEEVLALPGIGRSTAGAILAFSGNQRHPILDGNVKRVLTRCFAIPGYPGDRAVEKRLWKKADRLTPRTHVAAYTQAIMDLGAMLCTRHRPACTACPLKPSCAALAQGDPEAYPQRRAKPRKPKRVLRMLVLRNRESKILLIKRPPRGIWGSLWALPEIPPEVEEYGTWCHAKWGVRVAGGQEMHRVRHELTHFQMEILPIVCEVADTTVMTMDNRRVLWYNPQSENPVALPAAMKKIFKQVL